MKVGAVLLAAGASRRFGGSRPKQFLTLKGGPLFLFSLSAFLRVPSVKEIVVVVPKNFSSSKIPRDKKIKTVPGGSFRGESVRNGVKALSANIDVVLVHDTARPLVSRDIIERVARAAHKKGAALAAWPLPDTLKWADAGARVKKTIPRKNLWLAQTPQGFRRRVALDCLLKPSATATDDAELAERKGVRVQLVEGAPTNMKVTYPHDFAICEAILHEKK
jgi:2-C-methyl-D-erythritol 4-phosphate cytidylyltransferase